MPTSLSIPRIFIMPNSTQEAVALHSPPPPPPGILFFCLYLDLLFPGVSYQQIMRLSFRD